MKIYHSLSLSILILSSIHAGPYAPAVGQPGSDAIHRDDPSLCMWANGHTNYLPGLAVDIGWQVPSKAYNKAEGNSFDVLPLGRGGEITLLFPLPIFNGPGADFAVFENALNETFLELAFVEVSSDGIHFFRFPNISLTSESVPAFGEVDPTNIDGLASKYLQGYGTPFNLEVLKPAPAGLNLNRITHLRIVDIIGDGSKKDSLGQPIYDPYPTAGSAGFDLDAVAVIHPAHSLEIQFKNNEVLISFPTLTNLNYQLSSSDNLLSGVWTNLTSVCPGNGTEVVKTNNLPPDVSNRFYRLLIP